MDLWLERIWDNYNGCFIVCVFPQEDFLLTGNVNFISSGGR